MPPLYEYSLSPSSKQIHALGPMLPRPISREDSVDDYNSWHKEMPLPANPLTRGSRSLSSALSFEFDSRDTDDNLVFDKIMKPIFQGKQPDPAYLNPQDRQLVYNPDISPPITKPFPLYSAGSKPSADNTMLASQVAKRFRQPARNENLVNGLSRWDSVSSINSNDSFFINGNCHPEYTHDISTILEEGGMQFESENMPESGKTKREADTTSDSGDTERDSEEMSNFDDDSRTGVGSRHSREVAPVASSFSNDELKKEAWGSDTQRETTAKELEDLCETAPTFSSHSKGAYDYDISNKPPYDTRSGQTPAKKMKFRSLTKRRTQARAQSAKPYDKHS